MKRTRRELVLDQNVCDYFVNEIINLLQQIEYRPICENK